MLLVASVSACQKSNSISQTKVRDEFKSVVKPVSDNEHVVILDIPEIIGSTRCVVYSNEKTNTSNMTCELTSPKDYLAPPEPDGSRY